MGNALTENNERKKGSWLDKEPVGADYGHFGPDSQSDSYKRGYHIAKCKYIKGVPQTSSRSSEE